MIDLPKPPDSIWEGKEEIKKWSIFMGYRGSISHGLYDGNPESIDDIDLISICVPPLKYFYGLKEFGSRGTKELFVDQWDVVAYDIKKLISMLAKGNPNVLSLLWLPGKYCISSTEAWNLLTLNRKLFATKQVYKSFVGYAYGQLKRAEKGNYQGYMGAKRKALFDKHGFDCKNMSHLIRLLRQGAYFLRTGVMQVDRNDVGDAVFLRAIKEGKVEFKFVKREAEELFKSIECDCKSSFLPEKPDMEAIDNLCCSVVKQGLKDLHST